VHDVLAIVNPSHFRLPRDIYRRVVLRIGEIIFMESQLSDSASKAAAVAAVASSLRATPCVDVLLAVFQSVNGFDTARSCFER